MSDDVLSWERFYNNSKKRNSYPPKEMDLFNRLVAHSENFFAISAIGPFTEGYLLIITKKLLSSVPNIKDRLKNKLLDTIEGYVPEPIDLPNICKFYNRCPESFSKCENTNPEMFNLNYNTSVRCLLYM